MNPQSNLPQDDIQQLSPAARRAYEREMQRLQQQAQQPQPQLGLQAGSESKQGIFGDLIDAFQQGIYQSIAGDAETVYQLTGSGAGLRDLATDRADLQQETMSPAMQQAMGKELFTEDENGKLRMGEGFTDPRTWAGSTANLAGQWAGVLAPGAGIAAAGTRIGTKVAGKLLGKEAAKNAAPAIRATSQAVGFGTAGAASAGGMMGIQARDEVMAMPDAELDESTAFRDTYWSLADQNPDADVATLRKQAREQVAEMAATQVQSNPALITSNFALEAVGGKMLDDLLRGGMGTGSRLKNMGQQVAVQGSTGAAQGGIEQYALNQAMIETADPGRDPMEGVKANAATEGVLSGGLGGVAGGIRKGTPAQDQPAQPEESQPEIQQEPEILGLPAPEQPLMLENQNIIYGEAPPAQPNPAAEITRQAFEEPYTEPKKSRKADQPEAEAPQAAPIAKGQRSKAWTPDNEPVEVSYAVIDLDQLKISHDEAGRVNPDYPQELQQRERENVASRVWIAKTAAQLNPERLADSPNVSDGAPIIGSDGVVESGNGRSAAIRLSYLQNAPQAKAYKAYVTKKARELGVPPEQIMQMKQPVLVRVREGETDRLQFTRKANKQQVASQNRFEQARTDAEKISSDMMRMWQPSDTDGALAASNQDFVRAFAQELGQEEAASLMRNDGRANADMGRRIEAAVFHKAYQNDALVEMQTDIEGPYKNLMRALSKAAPDFAVAREYNPELSGKMADFIGSAFEMAESARSKGLTINQLIAQGDAFSEATPAEVKTLATFISVNRSKPTRLSAMFTELAAITRQQAEQGTTENLFGDQPLTPQEIINEAASRTERNNETDAGTGAQPRQPDPDGRGEVDTSTQRTATVADAPEQAQPEAAEVTPEAESDQPLLESYTQQEIEQQAQEQRQLQASQAKAEREAEQREQADREADDFVLAGSNSQTDQAEARGQNNLFDQDAQEVDTSPAEAKPGAEPATGVSREQAATPIEDAGEKLGGARKDEMRTVRERLESMDDAEIASSTLSKLWPKNEINNIQDNAAAAIYQTARDHIPSKPRKPHLVKRWVESVKLARELVSITEERGGETVLQKMHGNWKLLPFLRKIEVLAGLPRDQWVRIGRVELATGEYMQNDNWVKGSWFIVEIDNRRQTFYGHEKTETVIPEIKAALEENQPTASKMKFEIRRVTKTGEVFINKAGDSERRRLKTFDSVAAARAFMNTNYDELVQAWDAVKNRDNVAKADVRSNDNLPRTGKDHRQGKDVTADEFLQAFGFRGVEFGNWVKQSGKNARERQDMLNDTYDAFMDLADVLNIPPEALSLNGRLGIGLGSRGSGSANAHFESVRHVINLTKTKGAGALAHEWFHALDNYFARQRGEPVFDGDQNEFRRKSYVTYQPEPTMVYKPSYEKGRINRITKAEYDQRVKNNVIKADDWMLDPDHPQGIRPEVEKAFADIVHKLDESPMRSRSSIIDKGKSDGYWSRIIERGARAFETYVITSMADQGFRNDFLSNVVPVEEFARNPDRYPYLTEAEQKPINEAFDKLFETLETRETPEGVALFKLDSGGATGIPREQAAAAIKDQLGKLASRVNVIDTPDQLPLAAQLALHIQGVDPANAQGIYHDGQVYAIASNLDSIQNAIDTAIHEVVGHEGLRGLLGERLDAVMDQVYQSHQGSQQMKQLREHYDHLDYRKKADQRILAEELIAHLAEQQSKPKLLQRVISAIRAALRQVFPNIRWTGPDVYALIDSARRYAERENFSRADSATRTSLRPDVFKPITEEAEAYRDALRKMLESKKTLVPPITLGRTPPALRELNTPDLPIGISRDVVRKATNGVKHDVPMAVIEQLPELLHDPVAVFEGSEKDSLLVLVDSIDSNGAPIVSAIHFSKRQGRLEVNSLASVYGKDRPGALSKNKLLYLNKKKNPELVRLMGLQLPASGSPVQGQGFNVVTPEDLVNRPTLLKKRQTIAERFPDTDADQQSFLGKIGADKPGAMERAGEWLKKTFDRIGLRFRQGAIDKYAALMEMDKKLFGESITDENIQSSSWVLARMATSAGSVVGTMMEMGRVYWDAKNKVIDVQEDSAGKGGLAGVLYQLGSAAEIERFMGWVAANRSKKLAAEGRENLFTPEEIEAGVRLNQGKTESNRDRAELYKKVFKEFQQYRDDVLQIAEASGIITPENRKMWKDEFYVPFYRVQQEMDTEVKGVRTGKGLTRQEAYKRLKGGNTQLNDLLQNTLMNFNHLIEASLKNVAATQAMDNAAQLGIAEQVNEAGRDTKTSTFVLRDGQKTWYQINDPMVYNALIAMQDPPINFPGMGLMRKFKRVFTQAITATPQFQFSILMRDSMQAIATSKMPYNVPKNILKGAIAYGVNNKTSLTKARMMATGGSMSFGNMLGADPEAAKLNMERNMRRANLISTDNAGKVLRKSWDYWMEVTNTAENINRTAIFEHNYDQSKLKAAWEARDLIDYSQHGSSAVLRFFIDVVPFLNARIQGLDKLYRSGFKPTAKVVRSVFGGATADASDKAAAKRFSLVVGALSLATVALYLNNKDNEEYEKLEDWDKDTYWHFFVGGAHFRLHKPFEVGAIATLVERITQQFVDEKATGKLFAQRLGHMLAYTFSMDPTPQAINPMMEVWANKNKFTGRQIESMAHQRLSPSQRVNPNTTKHAQWISRGLEGTLGAAFGKDSSLVLSPVQIDHLIGGYLGQIGASASSTADVIFRSALGETQPEKRWHEYQPFRRFYQDTTIPGYEKYGTLFYDRLTEVRRVHADIQNYQKIGELERAREMANRHRSELGQRQVMERASRQLTALRARANIVRNNHNLSPEEKRAELDRIRAMQNRLQKMVVDRLDIRT